MKPHKRCRRRIMGLTLTIVSSCLIFCSGCMFGKLREDLKIIDASCELSGTVHHPHGKRRPVIVALLRMNGDTVQEISDYSVILEPGSFQFRAAPGDYQLWAVEDVNGDFVYQKDEFVGWHGNPSTIHSRPGTVIGDLTIALRPPEEARAIVPELNATQLAKPPVNRGWMRLGELISLKPTEQDAESGRLGLWSPVQFIKEQGIGIYFLQKFDPSKIPVLMVHGAGGSPGEWADIADSLDNERFQPWVMYYPSGLRLPMLAEGMLKMINELRVKHRLKEYYIIAHSMGGLISRGYLNLYVAESSSTVVPCFITLSTPWSGHESARKGVERAPSVVPSWIDMVPESPYLTSLFDEPLPQSTAYYLLFSYRGSAGLFNGANNDGVVTLKSQLNGHAQQAAVKVLGFDESHTSILKSKEVKSTLCDILNNHHTGQ